MKKGTECLLEGCDWGNSIWGEKPDYISYFHSLAFGNGCSKTFFSVKKISLLKKLTNFFSMFQTNKMAVTTSVFPNLNTFSHGPEYCVLFRKLQSTCKSHKRATLMSRYDNICNAIESTPKMW